MMYVSILRSSDHKRSKTLCPQDYLFPIRNHPKTKSHFISVLAFSFSSLIAYEACKKICGLVCSTLCLHGQNLHDGEEPLGGKHIYTRSSSFFLSFLFNVFPHLLNC